MSVSHRIVWSCEMERSIPLLRKVCVKARVPEERYIYNHVRKRMDNNVIHNQAP
jgi:hypothetical protein